MDAFRNVESLKITIKFKDGGKVKVGLGYDEDWANGQQPWIGASVDVRESIQRAMNDDELWARDEDDEEVDDE